MDEEDFMNVLDDLHSILKPVTNNGASREQLAAAVKEALEVIEDVYDELDVELEEEEEEDEPDEEPELESEEETQ
jgi:hypothetical protein